MQNCLKMICLSRGTEITNRNGLLLLYFKRKLPEPFPREKYQRSGSGLRICLHVAETNSGQFRRMKWCIPGMHFPVLEATHDHYMTEIQIWLTLKIPIIFYVLSPITSLDICIPGWCYGYV